MSDSDADIDDFLSKTKCFENQFLHQVQSDILAKEKAQTEMVQDCIDVAHDEYNDFHEQELRDQLVRDMKASPSRVKLFLES